MSDKQKESDASGAPDSKTAASGDRPVPLTGFERRFKHPVDNRELVAHREAAAHYAQALRFADSLPLEERALLHTLRAEECYLTDQQDEAIAAARGAIACYRQLDDSLGEGRATLRQVNFSCARS